MLACPCPERTHFLLFRCPDGQIECHSWPVAQCDLRCCNCPLVLAQPECLKLLIFEGGLLAPGSMEAAARRRQSIAQGHANGEIAAWLPGALPAHHSKQMGSAGPEAPRSAPEAYSMESRTQAQQHTEKKSRRRSHHPQPQHASHAVQAPETRYTDEGGRRDPARLPCPFPPSRTRSGGTRRGAGRAGLRRSDTVPRGNVRWGLGKTIDTGMRQRETTSESVRGPHGGSRPSRAVQHRFRNARSRPTRPQAGRRGGSSAEAAPGRQARAFGRARQTCPYPAGRLPRGRDRTSKQAAWKKLKSVAVHTRSGARRGLSDATWTRRTLATPPYNEAAVQGTGRRRCV